MQTIEEFGTQMGLMNPGNAVEKLRERMLETPDMRIVTMTGDARRLSVVFEPKPPKPLKLSAALAPLFGKT